MEQRGAGQLDDAREGQPGGRGHRDPAAREQRASAELLRTLGPVGLAEATPTGYREKGRFTIADKGFPSWAHPVISDGRLYVRNQDSLTTYDIKAK